MQFFIEICCLPRGFCLNTDKIVLNMEKGANRFEMFSRWLVLAGVMLLACLTAGAQDEVVYYDLWLGSTQVTSANKENILGQIDDNNQPTAKFEITNAYEYRLTLNNPTIEGTHENSKIYVGDLNNGTKDEKLEITGNYKMSSAESDYGIYSEIDLYLGGNLTIYGNLAGVYSSSILYLTNYSSNGVVNIALYGGEYGVEAPVLFLLNGHSLNIRGGIQAYYGDNIDVNSLIFYHFVTPFGCSINNGQFYEFDGVTIAKHVSMKNFQPNPNGYNLWLGNVEVTDVNQDNILNQVDESGCPTAMFDPEKKILTLNNPTIEGTHNNSKIYAADQNPYTIDIYLYGCYNMTNAEADYGLWTGGNLFFEDCDFTFYGNKNGIYAGRDFTMKEGASIKALGGEDGLVSTHLEVDTKIYKLELQGGNQAYCGGNIQIQGLDVSLMVEIGFMQYNFPESDGTTIAKHVIQGNDFENTYNLWLGNKEVTRFNKRNIFLKLNDNGEATAEYSPTDNTLIMRDPTITGIHTFGGNNETAVIYSGNNGDLSIRGSYHQTTTTAQYGIAKLDNKLILEGDFTFYGTEYGVNANTLYCENVNLNLHGETGALLSNNLETPTDVIQIFNIPENGYYSTPNIYDEYDNNAKDASIVFEQRYKIWLGVTQITFNNKNNILQQYNDKGESTAEYSPTDNTLILRDPTITGVHTFGDNNETAVIYSGNSGDLSIRGTYHQTAATAQYGIAKPDNKLNLEGDFTFYGTEYGLKTNALYCGNVNMNLHGGTGAMVSVSYESASNVVQTISTPENGYFRSPDICDEGGIIAKNASIVSVPIIYYGLWLGWTQVTSVNKDDIFGDGKASFYPETSTLVLDEPTINGPIGYKIKSWLDHLTIKGNYHMDYHTPYSSGLCVQSVSFDGDFILYGNYYGVEANMDVTVESGTLEVYGGTGIKCRYFTVNDGVEYVNIINTNIALNCTDGIALADGYSITTPKGGIFKDGYIQNAEGNQIASKVYIQNIANPINYYELWLGYKQIHNKNKDDIFGDGKANYEPETNTLYLNEPDILGTKYDCKIFTNLPNLTVCGNYHMNSANSKSGIRINAGNLSLNGNFTIMSKGDWQDNGNKKVTATCAPLFANGDLTLNGNITLVGEDVIAAAIASGDINVTGGNIQASSGYDGANCNGSFTVKGSTESIILDGENCAVCTRNFVIDNAEGEHLKIYQPTGAQFLASYNSVYDSNRNIAKHLVLRHPQQFDLWVGNTRVDSDNMNDILGNGTASFDPETNTLTLNNPTISGQTNDCAIYAEHMDLTVKGSATVSTTADCGIKVLYGRLTCEGNISLTGSEYALWSTNGLRLGQTTDITSPTGAKYNQIGKEYTVYESDGNTVAKSVTIQNLNKYRIWLGSTQVTSLNRDDICGDGKAKYDPDTRTLTLNNPTISDTYSNSKIFIQNTDITIKGRYTMNAAESTFGLYISGGRLSLSGDMTFRGSSMGIVTDDYLYIRGNIKAYGDSYTGIKAPKGITLEHGLMPTRLEMACSNGAYEGGHILPAVTLVTPNGGTITNLDESTTRIYSNFSGGVEATDVVLEYRYPAHGIGTAENPYLIRSDDDWNLLAEDIESGMTTAGKYFELLGNITATTMLGTEEFPFSGTFDGRSFLFTLTADISQEDEAYCAPFQFISGATIKNVKVNGSVTGGMDCAGLVGFVSGGNNLIENCRIGTTVSTYLSNCGGVVGNAGSATTTLSGTVFDGSIIGTTRGSGGGNGLYVNVGGALNSATMVGRSNNDATITLTGCLDLSGSDQPIGQGTATLNVTNTYYTKAGKKNTEIDSWSGKAKLGYRVEGRDVDLTLAGAVGTEPDSVIYAAQGETVSFTVNPNYVLYTSTAGTFNQDPNNVSNCTLVMPAENVTILDKNLSSFTITLNNVEHGTVTVPQSSKAGAAVFIDITPDDYYWIDELTVKDGNNNDIVIEYVDKFRYFRMPNSNVTITVNIEKKYSLENGLLHLLRGDFSGGASINSFDPLEIHTTENPNVTRVIADPGVRFTGYCGGLFQNFSICTSIDLSNVETSTMTAMTGMFAGCSSLKTLNLTGINTAQVTDMSHLFEDCISLREFDLTVLNYSNVKDMYLMFDQCGICKLTLPAGMVVTPDMGLRDGWYGQVGNEWVYSGWTLLGSGGTVVSTLATITVKEQERHYARITALPLSMTVVWKHMPDEYVLEMPVGEDNSETVELWDGVTANVKLTGSVLYKDGRWNTLCVPFEVPYGNAVNNALPDAVIYMLDTEYYYADNGTVYGYHETTPPTYNTGFDESTGTLRLYFKNHGELNAGKPHIIRWSKPDGYVAYDGTNADACSDIVSPTFTNVTIDKTMSPVTSDDGNVTFMGTYAPFADTEGLMFDEHNTGNGAFQAALQIVAPAPREGYTYGGRFTDAGFNTPATVIPLGDDVKSATTLYEKWTRNTVVLTALSSGSSVAELESNWAGKTVDVSFTRAFTQDVASTICLPYPMTSIPAGGSVYEFVDVQNKNGVWEATMSDATPSGNKVDATVAGKPYLFMPSATGDVTFTGTVVVPEHVTAGTSTSSANDGTWTFSGTYSRLDYMADGSADLSGSVFGFASTSKQVENHDVTAGEFVKAKDGAYVPAFRAYLTYQGTNNVFRAALRGAADDSGPDIPDRITVRLLGKDGTVTAVGTMNTATGDVMIEKWFDLLGRPVEGTPQIPGMYINNSGSKLMIK